MHECNIVDNGQYAFAATTDDNVPVIDATNNWWGTTNLASIEDLVFHQADSSLFPEVDYDPFAWEPFQSLSVEETPSGYLPTTFTLYQNYPNPFNQSTVIEFDLLSRNRVRIAVINVLGQEVRTLVDDVFPVGNHRTSWDGTDGSGIPVASGIYFYHMQTDIEAASRKLLLLK